jgi:hypothetical protein
MMMWYLCLLNLSSQADLGRELFFLNFPPLRTDTVTYYNLCPSSIFEPHFFVYPVFTDLTSPLFTLPTHFPLTSLLVNHSAAKANETYVTTTTSIA